MNLNDLQRNWNQLGKQDPLWAVISYPDKKGGKWTPEQFFQMGKDDISQFFQYLSKLGVVIPRWHALDFGCGVGRLTQAMAASFDKVAGVDIAPSMIKLAQQYNRFEGRCRYYLNERDDLALFKDNSFDLVFSLITLQHIHPQYVRRYLAEFLRVLVPGGVLYFQLPSRYLGSEDTRGSSDGHHETVATGHGIRALVKNVMPEPLRQLYRTVRDWKNEPIMEMYGIERSEVESLLKKHKGVLVDVVETLSTLSKWESFCYCVTKL
ncbi:MAG: class I SAM-dependent methyltransferase [Nitrospirota bacterium]